jgi:hypothetical protein
VTARHHATVSRASQTLAALAASALLVSCAAQAPPQPPRVEVPQAVADLAVRQVGATLELSFTLPKLAMDGEQLTKPLEIQILRGTAPAPGNGSTVLTPWVSLRAADAARFQRGPKIAYSEGFSQEQLRQSVGTRFTFAIRTLTRGFRGRPIFSPVSQPVSFTLLDVSEPVGNVMAQVTERAIVLTWPAPSRSLTGGPVQRLSGYHVYRSDGDRPRGAGESAAQDFRLVGLPEGTRFADSEFRFGHTYVYRVRAVFKQDAEIAESSDSPPVFVHPVDVFPPAPPTALTGTYTGAQVELIWNISKEADLAGYNVYRSEGAAFRKLNSALLPTPVYRDADVVPGRTYAYRVTAVDQAGNESAPSEVVRVAAELQGVVK